MHRNLAWAAELGVAIILIFALISQNCSTESASLQSFTIEATATGNGSIAPLDVSTVAYGTSMTYTMTPGEFGELKSITVDGTVWWTGTSLTVKTYTFSHVHADHTISCTFNSPG